MIATTPAAEFNDTLARLKLDSLNKLAKALADAEDPIDICRITKVLLTAKPIAPPKADGRAEDAHPKGRPPQGAVGADRSQETTDAPDDDRRTPGTRPRTDRAGRHDHAADESLDQHGNRDRQLHRRDGSPDLNGDSTDDHHAPRPAEVDERHDALAVVARQQHRVNAIE